MAYTVTPWTYGRVNVMEWNGSFWLAPVPVNAPSGQAPSPALDLSIVARGAWNLDVLYRGVFGSSFDATWNYGNTTWTSAALP